MSTTPRQRPGKLLWIVPLVSLSILFFVLALPNVWRALDLDPTPVEWMGLVGTVLAFVIVGWLIVWFFAFTWVSRRIKTICFIVLVLLVGSGYAIIDELAFDSRLRPRPRFRWQVPPAERLTAYQESSEDDTSSLPPIDLTINPVSDFPRYRGLRGDGIIHRSDLLDLKWEQSQPREVWRRPCGGGFSGLVVAGNVTITLEQRGSDEAIVCYDRDTGVERWVHAYPAWFKDITGKGPRATPTIDQGEVFSLGALGDLVCLDGTTGAKKWSVNILEDNQAKVVTWGMTSSPLVVDELVIVNAGIDPENNVGRAVVAYDRKTGKRVWAAGTAAAGYSSPLLARLAGLQQVVLFDAGGLAGFDLKSGEELWRYPWTTYKDMNIIQPVLCDNDCLFISSAVANGCALVRITRQGNTFSTETVWKNKFLGAKQANPLRMGNYLFGLHEGKMTCLEMKTGRRLWRHDESFGQGQMLLVSNVILVQTEYGQLVLVSADPTRYEELGRMTVFTQYRTWNTPAMVGRKLFLRNDEEMVCYEWPLLEH